MIIIIITISAFAYYLVTFTSGASQQQLAPVWKRYILVGGTRQTSNLGFSILWSIQFLPILNIFIY